MRRVGATLWFVVNLLFNHEVWACSPISLTVVGPQGRPIPGGTFDVSVEDTGVAATIYSDRNCSVVLTDNTIGNDGIILFWVTSGTYTVTASGAGVTRIYKVSTGDSSVTTAIVDGDFVGSDGLMRKVGAGVYSLLKIKTDAVVAPTANDDSADGYDVGSIWVDTLADRSYICVDATPGAAVWVDTSMGGITELNGQTGATQTFETSTGGFNFTITSTGNTHTFALPDASLYARGLINTTNQQLRGFKRFDYAGILSPDTNFCPLTVSRSVGSSLCPIALFQNNAMDFGDNGIIRLDNRTYTLPELVIRNPDGVTTLKTVDGRLFLEAGTDIAPAVTRLTDSDTGLYFGPVDGIVGLTANSLPRMIVYGVSPSPSINISNIDFFTAVTTDFFTKGLYPTDITMQGGRILNESGTVTAPSYSFRDDTDTGFYREGPGTVSLASDGVLHMRATPIDLQIKVPVDVSNFLTVGDTVEATTVKAGANLELATHLVNGVSSTITTNTDLSGVEFRGASFFPVSVAAGPVDIEVNYIVQPHELWVAKTFAVVTGHTTNALTITADAAGITTVKTINTAGTTCEDEGDMIVCRPYDSQKMTCTTFCAD